MILKPWNDFVINEYGVLKSYRGHGKHVVLPDTVKSIGSDVFSSESGHGDVVSVTVPEGVLEIRDSAFYGSKLEHIELPSTLKIIEDSAFMRCRNLRSITIPDGVTDIRSLTFMDSGLEEIHLPKNLRLIEFRAFYDCKKLKKIDFPKGENIEIQDHAFDGCTGLRNESGLVIVGDQVVYFEPENAGPHIYVNIPDHITLIKDHLFNVYPFVHLTMSLHCPSWPVKTGQHEHSYSDSLIVRSGSSIAFRDKDGDIAAKVILATEGEDWMIVQNAISSIRCRESGGFDFAAYDSMFYRLRHKHNQAVMALVRLRYPYELPEEMEKEYTAFLRDNCADLCKWTINGMSGVLGMEYPEILNILEQRNAVSSDVIREVIAFAQEQGRNELVADLLAYQKKKFGEEDMFASLRLPDDADSDSGDAQGTL